ncbi:MAG: hypothetical protein H0V89_11905 [Deltaproteobacteria bacterium]|nr:hypothetical protein [Deltaproteobacteria bacterium]
MIVRLDEPLARHTAIRTGGLCGAFVVVESVDELAEVTAQCRAADWKWSLLGHGTRTVYRDGAWPGAVVRLGAAFAEVSEGWRVGAAVPVPALVARAAEKGCAGIEDFAATAGSFGASLALDDGWDDVVADVEVLHRNKVVAMPLAEARKGKVILGATLALKDAEPDAVRRRVDRALAATSRTKASSWYAVPGKQSLREVFASVLLPRVRLREVAIPSTAPELLVNLGGGTAADLLLLHRSAVERVKSTRGIELDSRVLWAGGAS